VRRFGQIGKRENTNSLWAGGGPRTQTTNIFMPTSFSNSLQLVQITGFCGYTAESNVNVRLVSKNEKVQNGLYSVDTGTWANSRTMSLESNAVIESFVNKLAFLRCHPRRRPPKSPTQDSSMGHRSEWRNSLGK